MRADFFILTIVFFLFSFAAAAKPDGKIETDIISYKIKPIPQSDRTNLEIFVQFKTNSGEPLKIKLPTDNFGTPDLHKYVTQFAGENGTSVTAGERAIEKIIQPAPDGGVALRYTISYDPKEMDKYAYAPNTGANYFHLAGCQWLLHIGDDKQKSLFRIEIGGAPAGWKLYSSKSADARKFEIETSYDDLISAPFGGGENSHVFNVKNGRVSIFVHGDYEIPRARIYASIEKIVRLEREWFDDYAQPDYTIVVAPRSGVVAGYAPENSFVCFVKRDVTDEDLNLLIAHEFFHNWLPNKIEIVPDNKFSSLRFEWFSEGFTDYFAQKILRQANLVTPEKFAELINRNIYNIADNPHRNKTYDELVALGKAGKFDGTAKKLAYFRGALIALNWEARLARAGGKRNLSDFIRALFQTASKSNGKIPEKDLFEMATGYGIDARSDFERYIIGGAAIIPETGALGKNYVLRETEKAAFDVGFSLEETQKTGKISGVKTTSRAFQAGLRDGMEFVGTENAYRFSNAWKEDKPLLVKVKIDGQERRIEYFPHGELMKLFFYKKIK